METKSILGLASWQLLRGAKCQEDLSGNMDLVWDEDTRGGKDSHVKNRTKVIRSWLGTQDNEGKET